MPEIVDPEDIEMLQDTIVAAVNEAYCRWLTKTKGNSRGLTGGLM